MNRYIKVMLVGNTLMLDSYDRHAHTGVNYPSGNDHFYQKHYECNDCLHSYYEDMRVPCNGGGCIQRNSSSNGSEVA